eukprot:CAMPEP_0185411648 /NCGR_PEP_ID=MMETSP1365-20130426/3684_1 /TAXON_ID=38817 /ORGANISM="Gephyrocapsa oceanica, Strain RCC1303" /LENGTH=272 /DNA_ID=CAMNT_0028014271 /DNA_START=88 /DNA_END=903 /DNA_ORIENTATION=+
MADVGSDDDGFLPGDRGVLDDRAAVEELKRGAARLLGSLEKAKQKAVMGALTVLEDAKHKQSADGAKQKAERGASEGCGPSEANSSDGESDRDTFGMDSVALCVCGEVPCVCASSAFTTVRMPSGSEQQLIRVTVPPHAVAGSEFTFTSPTGASIRAGVPDGVGPGQVIHVRSPEPTPQQIQLWESRSFGGSWSSGGTGSNAGSTQPSPWSWSSLAAARGSALRRDDLGSSVDSTEGELREGGQGGEGEASDPRSDHAWGAALARRLATSFP